MYYFIIIICNYGISVLDKDGPDRIRTGDLTLRKRSHYPSYATSPKSLANLGLIWIAISQIQQKCTVFHRIHETSKLLEE